MRAGEFADGARTLRAKIDMAAPNINLRDPVMYRILHAAHHRTGDKWCIYPDVRLDARPERLDRGDDALRSARSSSRTIGRSIRLVSSTQLGVYHPQQIEFARLNLTRTVLSKRRLKELVEEGHVWGWDDPRMPTLAGLRRRGYTPEAIREFLKRVGVAKTRQRHRHRAPGALPEGGPQQARPARDGGAEAASGGHRELPRGQGRGVRGREQPRGP